MGILKQQFGPYYDEGGNHGGYKQLSLAEIIQSFNASYVGKGKICEDVLINDVTFHAIRGLQELSYDTLRSEKDWELIVPSTLMVVLPVDYVNYVKISWSDSSGIERLLYPAIKTSNPLDITEVNTVSGTEGEAELWGGFDTLDDNTDITTDEVSATAANFQSLSPTTSNVDANDTNDLYGNAYGQRFGIDPQHAQTNGSFFIDESQGRIHLSSNVAGKTLVLKYISDGLVQTPLSPGESIDLSMSYVHKFAEEAIYKHILYGCLMARKDTDPRLLMQLKKERFAQTRNAKIRLSNIKSEELTQVLRGSSKQIKH
tara:strand:+ start:744 stop:1688 length:945 start_codon:yes stop_codon:yes gene_type:complete